MTDQKKAGNKPASDTELPEIYNVSKEGGSFTLSRRKFVKLAATASAVAVIAGCAPKAAPTKVVVTAKLGGLTSDLYAGPGLDYPFIGTLVVTDSTVLLIGLSGDALWVNAVVNISDIVSLPNDAPITQGGTVTQIDGWIAASDVEIVTGSLEDLPVESTPPTPTPLPNESLLEGSEGINYEFKDQYGNYYNYTVACGSPIPEGAVCTCNCVSICSCDNYVAPCACDSQGGGSLCTCNMVSYWYPN